MDLGMQFSGIVFFQIPDQHVANSLIQSCPSAKNSKSPTTVLFAFGLLVFLSHAAAPKPQIQQ